MKIWRIADAFSHNGHDWGDIVSANFIKLIHSVEEGSGRVGKKKILQLKMEYFSDWPEMVLHHRSCGVLLL